MKKVGLASAMALIMLCGAAMAAPQQPLPKRRLQYSADGVRIEVSSLIFGIHSAVGPIEHLTFIIENDRDAPISLAALYGGQGLQAVLTDGQGGACTATGVIGLPRVNNNGPVRKMREHVIPPRSRVDVVLSFQDCGHLSPTNLSFNGTFAMLVNAHHVRLITVPLWGINARRVR